VPRVQLPPLNGPDGTPRRADRRGGAKIEPAMEPEADPAALQVLADNHRRFLAFLERRVGSREAAEDILQDAFVRGIGSAGSLRDRESAVAWFYRLLRNAITDHFRRRGAEARALERYAAEPADTAVGEAELTEVVCACIRSLLATLKPEYAAALQRVEMDGVAVGDFAREAGITANNASVRVHRARLALRRQVERSCGTCATHGCYQCECRDAAHAPPA
jgi:RNA polymerase sigma factor (sigma-70 family)